MARPLPREMEAELTVVAESVDRYRERMAALAASAMTGVRSQDAAAARAKVDEHDAADLVAAIHEAERALRTAQRHLMRAVKLTRR